jgi:hypothetical protein
MVVLKYEPLPVRSADNQTQLSIYGVAESGTLPKRFRLLASSWNAQRSLGLFDLTIIINKAAGGGQTAMFFDVGIGKRYTRRRSQDPSGVLGTR